MSNFNTGIEDFTLRFATESDVGTILELIKALAAYEKMADQVTATEERLLDSIFRRGKAEVLIGEYKGEPVGFSLFFTNFSTFIGDACLYLEDLYVREPYRGRGFGSAFFKALASIAVERNYGRLDWVCLDWNAPSIQFYKNMGAVPLEDWTIYRLTGDALNRVAEQ